MRIFLEPKSIALIGAPRKTGPDTYNGVEMILRYGYKGKIYPINPKADKICGLKTYASIADVQEVIDLAIISVARDNVIPAVQECIKAGIRRIIIISQGFSDADQHGREMQVRIAALARENGVRILGPNTLGVINNFRSFSTSFVDLPRPAKVSPVSLIAQTGVIQASPDEFSYHAWGKAVDIGNSADVDFIDVLEYFHTDPETRVIVLHMEGILRGRELMKVAVKVSLDKPIIVFKTGRTTAGAKAALSHTGSLVGEDDINDAAFSRAGLIRVKNAAELKDAIRALVQFDDMGGTRLGVLTPSGAAGIMATDACEDFGLTMAKPLADLADKLKKGIPEWVHIGNPVDIWPVGMLGGGYTKAYKSTLTDLLQSPEIDGVLAMTISINSPLHKDLDVIEIVAKVRKETGSNKPIAMWVYCQDVADTVARLEKIKGVACFETIERAVQGLSFLYRYHEIKKRKIPVQRVFAYDRRAANSLLQKGRKQKILLGEDALHLLSIFGIPVVRGKLARSWQEIQRAAGELSYPLVLKLSGEAFLHKSEWGGVVANIRDKKELRAAWQKMKENVSRRNPELKIGFQLQKQAAGKEMLLGLKLDPKFGHILACGLGGIYTEVFKDVSREFVPVGRNDAGKMISSLKMYPLLKGVRGEAGVDREALLEILERLSFLATEVSDIVELDINPLMVDSSGCLAVDVRIIWE